jgi:predicted membrane channel-forming protein YqfA (hemolysin III family)
MPQRNSLMTSLRQDVRKLGFSAWLGITVLVILFVLAIVGVFFESTDPGMGLSDTGTIAAIGMGFFMILVGMGLMALIFYSSRRGYDESAERQKDDSDHGA